MVMLTMPLLVPVLSTLAFDMTWFGVLITVMLEMGLLTPPIALNAFVIHSVTKVPLWDVYRGLSPFLVAMVFGLALLIIFPQISLFIPSLMKGY